MRIIIEGCELTLIKKENKYLCFDQAKTIDFKFIVKLLLNFVQQIVYKFIFLFIRPKREEDNIKYSVSVCAIFRDEGTYLKEWLEFHLIAGVEHFYLYNNFSKDNYMEILKPYIDRNVVTLIDWPVKQGQFAAYQHFFDNYSKETKWVCLIDLDEFIVPNKYHNIQDFLVKFENRPCVIVYWKVFGSSGKIYRDTSGLVTEDFIVGYRKYIDIGKVFFNTKYKYDLGCYRGNDMHSMWAKYKNLNLPPVNVFDKICTYGINPVPNDDMPIQINHYLIKTYDEYITKKSKRGGGVHDISMHSTDYYFRNEKKCQLADYSAYKYLVMLKLAMNHTEKIDYLNTPKTSGSVCYD
ncbi:MAG: glycosyltransferase family 92 protein [Clostridia bacterium]|nr:glycosyltransferase family 92 protein [Clostridia bacterium]